MSSYNCSVWDCFDLKSTRHRFPNSKKNLELFYEWVRFCKNPRLANLDPNEIYNNYRICSSHFKSSDFLTSKRLIRNVIPTINLNITPSAESLYSLKNLNSPEDISTDLTATPCIEVIEQPPKPGSHLQRRNAVKRSLTSKGRERRKQKASNLPSTSNSGSDVPAIENPIQVTDILDQIVIKEETPDDDLGLILQCENVSDLDNVTIKEEPDEEPVEEPVPTVLNFVKEIQPVVFDLIVPEASTPTFNSDNIVRTYANVKKKPSTILSNQEDNISPEPLDKSCFNVVTQIDCDCKVSKKRQREKTEIPGSSKDFEESNNKFAGEICILCTKSSFEPLKDISSLLESKILFTADVMIHEHTLPKKACKPCVRMLDTCYKFKKQVLDSHKYICDQQESTVVPISERHTSSNADSLDDDEENTESDNDSSDECGSPHEPKKRILTYECIVCDSEFLNAPELEEHNILVHTKMDCKVCAFKPTNIIEHREHKKKHAPKQMGDKTKVCCEKCGEIVTKFRYTTHILEHDSKKVVECSVCNCSIPDTLLELHMKKHESKFVCEKCGTHFGDLRTYQRHIIKEHDRTFVCNICQKGFGDQPHLDKHIRLHSGEKPFACTVCDRKFNSKHNLATHVRIHTNTFPYKCNYCEESFRHNVTRKDHQKKVHSKELEEDKKLFVGGRQD